MLEISTSFPLLTIMLAIFVGAFVSGFAGFGLSAAAGALLLHVLPASSAIPLMMLCSVVSQITGLIALRKSLNWRKSFPFMLSGAAGVPIAIAIMGKADPETLVFGFGLFLIVYTGQALALPYLGGFRVQPELTSPSDASISVAGPDIAPDPFSIACVGFVGGIVGGLTAMPSAALVVWSDMRRCDKITRRATIQPFILAMQLLSLSLLAVSGQLLEGDILLLFALSVSPLFVGAALGLMLFGRVGGGAFRVTVLTLILISGAMMVVV